MCCCIYFGIKHMHKAWVEGFAKACDSKPHAFAVAVDNKGDLFGYIALGFNGIMGNIPDHEYEWAQPKIPIGTCRVEQIAVNAKARGMGLGKKLLQWAEDKAKERNCNRMKLEVVATNVNALRLYRNVGYEVTNNILSQICCFPIFCCLMG